jgi:hypothetical protein
MDTTDRVPDAWQGAWQRLQQGVDAPRAYWLQTLRLHASILIPAGRPDFSGASSLADLSLDELLWLAEQQGVAGTCIVEGDTLHRRRQVDFQTSRGKPFIRRMRREGELLREETTSGSTPLTWQRISPPEAEVIALRFQDDDGGTAADQRKGYLLVVGDCFLFVRDRGGFVPHAESLRVLAECKDYERETLIELLDFEASFGLRAGSRQPWEILLSTLPFREGKPLLAPGAFDAIIKHAGRLPQRVNRDGKMWLRRWSLDEWSGAG